MRDDMPRHTDKPSKDEIDLASFAGAGLQFAVAIVIFLLLGQWADRKLGTSPTFLLIGIFAGGGGAFYSMYRRISAAQKADDERRKHHRSTGSKQ
jgi:F0F1-type ATP synthase assembly protein I